MPNPTCSVDECVKPTRSPGCEWCAMHYHRWYRHGDVNATARNIKTSSAGRYDVTYQPNHPLATARGLVYTHRAVLFAAIGYGPHACHWCGTEVDWKSKGELGELHPDHLNGDTRDNSLENLAPSCRACNTTRGSQQRSQILREMGFWSRKDTVAVTDGRRPVIA